MTPLSPNPSLPVQTHPRSLTIFQKRESRSSGVVVDWNKVRRADVEMTEDEKEEVLDRLNKMVEEYRSLNTEYYVDPDDLDEEDE